MRDQVILLPGGVLPADLAYGGLLEALGETVDARPKDLEVYEAGEPPADYGLEVEVDAVIREAEEAGFGRFHLVGYSAGGAVSVAFAGRHPERLLSLALLEPAWAGNVGLSDSERKAFSDMEQIRRLPPEQMMARFVRFQLAADVEPPPPPADPPPKWMLKRPAGLVALMEAFERHELEPAALRSFDRPVYYALGALSNPGYYGEMAERLGSLFEDFTLDVYEDRHHFDPPHRVEADRLATRLRELWDRAESQP